MYGYSFCESVMATGESPWHIRPLTAAGRKFGGGADTKAFCGREVAWDLDLEINARRLEHCCRNCAKGYREREAGKKLWSENVKSELSK